jgi:hypothetical protein
VRESGVILADSSFSPLQFIVFYFSSQGRWEENCVVSRVTGMWREGWMKGLSKRSIQCASRQSTVIVSVTLASISDSLPEQQSAIPYSSRCEFRFWFLSKEFELGSKIFRSSLNKKWNNTGELWSNYVFHFFYKKKFQKEAEKKIKIQNLKNLN